MITLKAIYYRKRDSSIQLRRIKKPEILLLCKNDQFLENLTHQKPKNRQIMKLLLKENKNSSMIILKSQKPKNIAVFICFLNSPNLISKINQIHLIFQVLNL